MPRKPLAYRIPRRARFFRWLLRPLFRGLFHLLSRVRISGLENIPRRGAYLITINHVSLFEPPLVLAFWPVAAEAVGAVDIWERPGQSLLARLYGGIPVHRGAYDRRLIETMIAALHSGQPVLIAPEGGRSHSPGLRRGFPGVAYVMDRTELPVVPVGIVGATDDFLRQALRGRRPTLEMRIGQPFCLPKIEEKGEGRRKAMQDNTDRIMLRIADLLPAEYRGIYASPIEPVLEAA